MRSVERRKKTEEDGEEAELVAGEVEVDEGEGEGWPEEDRTGGTVSRSRSRGRWMCYVSEKGRC